MPLVNFQTLKIVVLSFLEGFFPPFVFRERTCQSPHTTILEAPIPFFIASSGLDKAISGIKMQLSTKLNFCRKTRNHTENKS